MAGKPRPLRADAARNRARVLEVAYETFAQEGLSVPIDEIARRAGVGAGTVYRHFPTKEALFRAIVASRLQRLIDSATPLLEGDDPGAAFFAFLALLVEEGEKDRAWSRRWPASGSTSRRRCRTSSGNSWPYWTAC